MKIFYRPSIQVKKDSSFIDTDSILNLQTDNMIISIQDNDQGYIIDVYDMEENLVHTATIWNDDLDLDLDNIYTNDTMSNKTE